MARFLDTRGRHTLGVGICDRCHRKAPLADLEREPDTGLRVHAACMDEPDPYRLPMRAPDRIALAFVRPDVPLDVRLYSDPPVDDDEPPVVDPPPDPDPIFGDFSSDFSSDFSGGGAA